jgi:hypothetical protein
MLGMTSSERAPRGNRRIGPKFYRERPILGALIGFSVIFSWPVAIAFLALFPFLNWAALHESVRASMFLRNVLDVIGPTASCARISENFSTPISDCENFKGFVALFMLGVMAAILFQIACHLALMTQIRRLARIFAGGGDGIGVAAAKSAPVYWAVCLATGYLLYFEGFIHIFAWRLDRSGHLDLGTSFLRYTIFNTFFMAFVMLSLVSPTILLADRVARRLRLIQDVFGDKMSDSE